MPLDLVRHLALRVESLKHPAAERTASAEFLHNKKQSLEWALRGQLGSTRFEHAKASQVHRMGFFATLPVEQADQFERALDVYFRAARPEQLHARLERFALGKKARVRLTLTVFNTDAHALERAADFWQKP